MTPLTLKSYQQAALDALAAFAGAAQMKGPARAFGDLHWPRGVRELTC